MTEPTHNLDQHMSDLRLFAQGKNKLSIPN